MWRAVLLDVNVIIALLDADHSLHSVPTARHRRRQDIQLSNQRTARRDRECRLAPARTPAGDRA
jgi:hypothetical protein